jgi:hypothetical protein
MTKYLIDTDILIDYFNEKEPSTSFVQKLIDSVAVFISICGADCTGWRAGILFFTMAPNVQSRARRTGMNKKRILAARKSDTP